MLITPAQKRHIQKNIQYVKKYKNGGESKIKQKNSQLCNSICLAVETLFGCFVVFYTTYVTIKAL